MGERMKTEATSLSLLLGVALLSCVAGTASAQLAISRFTVDSGGGGSAGGVFAMSGTAGQPDAGQMSGASFTLKSGFWAGGGGAPSGVGEGHDDGVEPDAPVPLAFRVLPANPNPVRESMVVAFDLPESRLVRMEIFDAAGRLVRVLADEQVRAWDRRDRQGVRVPAGIYFVRFDAGQNHGSQKVVVVS
jgi:hypothetical protein